MEPINDDVFKYDNSEMSQCISGFGRNAIDAIGDDLDMHMPGGEEHSEARERLKWHVEELVRWCRHFNGKSQQLEQAVRAMLEAKDNQMETRVEWDNLRKALGDEVAKPMER